MSTRVVNIKEELVKVLRSYDQAIEDYTQHHDEDSTKILFEARENLALALITLFQVTSNRPVENSKLFNKMRQVLSSIYRDIENVDRGDRTSLERRAHGLLESVIESEDFNAL